MVHEVGDDLMGLQAADRGALGNGHDQILAAVAVALVPRAVGARLRLAVGMVAEREQRGHVAVGLQPDVTALASVTAIGSALGHVGLAAHRDRAGTTVATLDVELRLVDEAPMSPVTHANPRLEPGLTDSSAALGRHAQLSGERTPAKQQL